MNSLLSREDDVERIDQFSFYEIGQSLAKLSRYEGDVPAHVPIWDVWEGQKFLRALLNGIPIPIGVSRTKALEVLQSLDLISDTHFTQIDTEGKKTFKYPQPGDPPVPSWRWSLLNPVLANFETVFREEMRETAVYFVPRRGIFYTPALVDAADESFPKDLLPFIPQKARDDWKAAGRCLAFNLLSASGFHTARAVEATLESYYQLFSGRPGETLRSWHDYKEALDKLIAAKSTPGPRSKTVAELDQMREDYRNPIMHPRVVLTEGDARMLFANGESLIIAMAQEIAEASLGIQPTLSLVGGKAADGQREGG